MRSLSVSHRNCRVRTFLLTPVIRQHLSESHTERAAEALRQARVSLQNAAPTLPAHDVQKYETELNDLQKALQSHASQSHTFSFQRPSRRFSLSSLSRRHSSTPSASASDTPTPSKETPAAHFADITHEIVRIPAAEHQAVHLHRLHHCIVRLGDVHGSVFVDECTYTVIVGAAQQCRLSRSSNVTVCVDAPTPITLEECRGLWIGNRSDLEPSQATAGATTTATERAKTTLPNVQDFDDVFMQGSNWSYLPIDAAVKIQTHLDSPYGIAEIL